MNCLEQLPFFLADVPGEQLHKRSQFGLVHRALSGVDKVFPQAFVFAAEFFHQRDELRKTASGGKQNLFFRCEMELNFVRIKLMHFQLPRIQIDRARLPQRPIEPHTERQRVLMLMGKGDQDWITQHRPIIFLC